MFSFRARMMSSHQPRSFAYWNYSYVGILSVYVLLFVDCFTVERERCGSYLDEVRDGYRCK